MRQSLHLTPREQLAKRLQLVVFHNSKKRGIYMDLKGGKAEWWIELEYKDAKG